MTGNDYNKVLAVTTAGCVYPMNINTFDPKLTCNVKHGHRPTTTRSCNPEGCTSHLVPIYGRRVGWSDGISTTWIWHNSQFRLTIHEQMASAAVKTVTQLCAIRFLLGLAEASTYAGTIYIIGAWYKPDEIAKRTALFTASGQVGTMFAGVMMAAIHKGMVGLGGLGGWQWVFLIGKIDF